MCGLLVLVYWFVLCFWNKNTEEWLSLLFLRCDVQLVRGTDFRVTLVTTSVPTPSGTYGPFSRSRVGIGFGARSVEFGSV